MIATKWIEVGRIAPSRNHSANWHKSGGLWHMSIVWSLVDNAWYHSAIYDRLVIEFSDRICYVYNPAKFGKFDVKQVIGQACILFNERPVSVRIERGTTRK